MILKVNVVNMTKEELQDQIDEVYEELEEIDKQIFELHLRQVNLYKVLRLAKKDLAYLPE